VVSNTGSGLTAFYFINDHLGTPQIVVDEAGTVVWEGEYEPFGEVNAGVEDGVNNFRFAGQYYDGETAMHYNHHRYYDISIGRYLTPDPIGIAGGLNLYVYASNNTVNKIDPMGLVDPATVAIIAESTSSVIIAGGVVQLNSQNRQKANKQIANALWKTSTLNPEAQLKTLIWLSSLAEGPEDKTNPEQWLRWPEKHDTKISEETSCGRGPQIVPPDDPDPDRFSKKRPGESWPRYIARLLYHVGRAIFQNEITPR
jgi:RHS repeat-associated protein